MIADGSQRGFLALAILVWSTVGVLLAVFLREWRVAHRLGHPRRPQRRQP